MKILPFPVRVAIRWLVGFLCFLIVLAVLVGLGIALQAIFPALTPDQKLTIDLCCVGLVFLIALAGSISMAIQDERGSE